MTFADSFDCAQKTPYPEIESMKFYPVVQNWSKKIRQHLENPVLQKVLVSDFNKYTVGCWGKRFRRGDYPMDFDGCDWREFVRGRPPRYFQYVSHGACHWLVNFNLTLAHFTEPKKAWRIVRSPIHSTVWDGEHTLFDLNGMAFCKGGAPECFGRAALQTDSMQLGLGELLEVGKRCSVTGWRRKPRA